MSEPHGWTSTLRTLPNSIALVTMMVLPSGAVDPLTKMKLSPHPSGVNYVSPHLRFERCDDADDHEDRQLILRSGEDYADDHEGIHQHG